MFRFSDTSNRNLAGCRRELQQIADRALAYNIIDFACICGHRPKDVQDRYFATGKSRVRWPDSKHNHNPSDAMDLVPCVGGQISWNTAHCCVLAGAVLAAAAELGYRLRWGGNWDMDGEPVTDQGFDDLVHFEFVGQGE